MRNVVLLCIGLVLIPCLAAMGEQPEWRKEARERIEKHRKADLVVKVVDADGQPVRGARVEVEMTRHAFGFGTAVNAKFLATGEREDVETYRAKIIELFNRAVLENGHKWDNWEDAERREQTVAAAEWLMENDIDLRGHTMLWQRRNSVPRDIVKIAWPGDKDWKDEDKPELTEAGQRTIRRRCLEHIAAIGSYEYDNGRIIEWDVVNEPIHVHGLTDLLNPDAPVTAPPLLVDWYKAAGKAAPEAVLYVNDYGMVNRGGKGAERRYEALCKFLLDSGAPLGGVGFQAHIGNGGHAPSGPELTEMLDRFAKLGLRLQITEFDMWGGGWGKGENPTRAEWVRTLLTVSFANPSMDGVLMWGFWDGRHWRGSAPLFKRDWSLRPEGKVWMDLVHGQWWTRETGITDGDGVVKVRGFLGDYKITAARDGLSAVESASLARDGAVVKVELGR